MHIKRARIWKEIKKEREREQRFLFCVREKKCGGS
jgi:hypothetical protein